MPHIRPAPPRSRGAGGGSFADVHVFSAGVLLVFRWRIKGAGHVLCNIPMYAGLLFPKSVPTPENRPNSPFPEPATVVIVWPGAIVALPNIKTARIGESVRRSADRVMPISPESPRIGDGPSAVSRSHTPANTARPSYHAATPPAKRAPRWRSMNDAFCIWWQQSWVACPRLFAWACLRAVRPWVVRSA